MSQRSRILSEILGYRGWKVTEVIYLGAEGEPLEPVRGYPAPTMTVVLSVTRTWASRCAECGAIGGKCHEQLPIRYWRDLPMSGRPILIAYAPIRVKCRRCRSTAVERLAWADPHQRQTQRLQQHLALDAFSMPILHVATKYGLGWHTVRRAEVAALTRWELTRPAVPLRILGLDEKYLGRRSKRGAKYVTIASNLETGEPIWIGFGRSEKTVASFLATLTPGQKAVLSVAAMDMHRPFLNAIRADVALTHVAICHDSFHLMKRGGEAISELRREVFFRAGKEMRRVGRGARWLVLRAWERCSEDDRRELRTLLSYNGRLARAYQTIETLRAAITGALDGAEMAQGLWHVLRRTAKRSNVPMRKLHDSIVDHWDEIVALGEHRPPVGRIEALNNNWETMVRRARGHRDLDYLLRKLRFVTANPVRREDGVRRFLALGLPAPTVKLPGAA